MVFSERLRGLMKARGITREELARRTDIPINTIGSYLKKNNPASPSIYYATKIANVLGVSLDYLAGVTETTEFKTTKRGTPDVLLINLYRAIKDLNMKVQLDHSSHKTVISSQNQYIYLFFSQIDQNIEDLYKIASRFKDLKVLQYGEIVDPVTYEYYLRTAFVYGDFTEEDRINLEPELLNEHFKQRNEEFDRLIKKKDYAEIERKINEFKGGTK
jgi:transcriptional regulator with XRE-family HTH domain